MLARMRTWAARRGGKSGIGRLCLCVLIAASTGTAWAAQAGGAGEVLYRKGVLADGGPLVGVRADANDVVGVAAACINCHRRSGLGMVEGASRVPPITAKYLFAPPGIRPEDLVASPGSVSGRVRPIPYKDASLALAIRTGIGRDGKPLGYLMPRYALDDASMRSLVAYLKSLPTTPAPGVTDTTIHFATIVTPDADPVSRDGMLAVLGQFATDKNSFIRGGRRPLKTAGQIDFRVTRSWEIHVWQLTGAAATWRVQLDRYMNAQPVFAVLSGLGGAQWGPVREFCDDKSLPCVFPNVDVPVVDENDFYSLYFSKAVLLEADMMRVRLREPDAVESRVIQVFRRRDSGEAAARALRESGVGRGIVFADAPVVKEQDLARAVASARPGDTLVFWLRAKDLATLPEPPTGVTVWISGLLAGLDPAALPRSWWPAAHFTYPVDLPELRRLRMSYPLNWFKVRHIPVLAERVQADTYLTCGIVSEALADVTDNYQRDYFIERIQDMLSRRQLSGYYPHLSLATDQRFASKGGYWVTINAASALVAESPWIVP